MLRTLQRTLIGATAVLSFSSSLLQVAALGSQCSAPCAGGTAGPDDPFWMENIKHQGLAAFNNESDSYEVFRNVLDYGAVGDGLTDDTDAINLAMSSGDRCGNKTCDGTTTSPAIIYFPPGTYLLKKPITTYYYTQMIGDARNPPTLLADKNFTGIAVIDADPYTSTGENWFVNQGNFYRSVRNFVIDLTEVPANITATGLHWQVSQATSLMNIVVNMNSETNTTHQGLFMENGSGGFMGDLVFNGGKYGMWVGNQQFTVRNITVNGAQSAIFGSWNWGWTFQGVRINDCEVGFNLTTPSKANNFSGVGGEAIIDAIVTNTETFILNSLPSNGTLSGSLVLNNIQLNNVATAVGVTNGTDVLEGPGEGSSTIQHWIQGNVYKGTNPDGTFVQANQIPPVKPGVLLDSQGHIVGRSHPQYENYAVDQFVSVRDLGATGDGETDDTAAIQDIIDKFSGCKIIFFDQGTYVITDTITIPAGTQIVGEAWSVIMGAGPAFQDVNNPRPMVVAGEEWSNGILEITDIVFTTRGPAPGAIVLEWNVRDPWTQQAAAGMWDSHIRLGGATGTDLTGDVCPNSTTVDENCTSAFLGLHLTQGSTAYLEGTWIWAADHTIDAPYDNMNTYSGRGVLSESQGPVWMVGTASEHHVLYQYNLIGAANHYIGVMQTETPYFQPEPAVPIPFTVNDAYHDPKSYTNESMAWATHIASSQDIFIFGAGLYSFFDAWNNSCAEPGICQTEHLNIKSDSAVYIYNLATVGTRYMLSVDYEPIIEQGENDEGFASLVSGWTPY